MGEEGDHFLLITYWKDFESHEESHKDKIVMNALQNRNSAWLLTAAMEFRKTKCWLTCGSTWPALMGSNERKEISDN